MHPSTRIRPELLLQLISDARRHAPLESCGLLAGPIHPPDDSPLITTTLPAPNALASPTAYEIAPADLFRLAHQIHAAGLLHLGIYHSHPATEAFPSETDIARAFYPGVAYFIISLLPAMPSIRAFHIHSGVVTELVIHTE